MKHVNIRLPKSDVMSYIQTMWNLVGNGVDYVQASPANALLLQGIVPPLQGLSIVVSDTQGDEILTCVTKAGHVEEVDDDDF